MEARRHAGIVGAALCRHLGVRSLLHLLPERLLDLQSDGLAIAVRVRRLVRFGWRKENVAHPVVPRHAVGLRGLSRLRVLRHADLVRAADEPLDAAPARAVDVSDRQDRSGCAALRAFPRARSDHHSLPTDVLTRSELALT